MASIFDKLSNVLSGRKPAPAAALDRLLDETRRHTRECEARLAALEASRPVVIVTGDGARLKLRADIAEAEADVLDARAAVAEIERRCAEQKAIEAEQGRRKAFDAAVTARRLAGERLTREYPVLAEAIVGLIAEIARADAAIERCNRDLPEGEAALVSTEGAYRLGGAVAARTLRDEVVELWTRPGSAQPLPADQQAEVRIEAGSGRGFLRTPGTFGAALYVERARFRRTEVLEAVTGAMPPALASISLPPLHGGGSDIWIASKFWSSPAAIAAAADALAEAGRRKADAPERPKVTKYELLPDPAPVTEGTIGAGVAA